MENDNENSLAPAIIAAIAGIVGAVIKNAGDKKRLEESQQFSERAATTAYERSLESFFQTQSIGAKVKDAQASGVNPASLFGSLASGSVPSVAQAATPSPMPVADILSTVTNLLMQNRSLDIQEMVGRSQARANNADADKKEAETKTIDLERTFIPALRSGEINKITEEFNLMREELNTEKSKQRLNDANVSLASANTLLTLLQYEIEDSTKDDKIRLAEALADSAEAKAETDKVNVQYADKRAKAEINVMTSQAFLNNANARQVKEFCIQYFENKDSRGKSLFQNLTLSQMNELQSCMRLNDERTGLVWKQGKEIDEKIKNIAADTALKYEDIRYYGSQVFMEGLKTGATVLETVMPKVNFSFGESTTTTTTYKEKGMTRSSSTTKSSSHGRKR